MLWSQTLFVFFFGVDLQTFLGIDQTSVCIIVSLIAIQ